MVGIKVKEVYSRITIGIGRTLNGCFINKNGNVASNMKLSKIENSGYYGTEEVYRYTI